MLKSFVNLGELIALALGPNIFQLVLKALVNIVVDRLKKS